MKPNDFPTSHPYHNFVGIEAQTQHLTKTTVWLCFSCRTDSLGSSIKETTEKHALLLAFGSMFACMRCTKAMKIYLKSKTIS